MKKVAKYEKLGIYVPYCTPHSAIITACVKLFNFSDTTLDKIFGTV